MNAVLFRVMDLHLLLSTFLALADPFVLSDRHPGQQVAATIHRGLVMKQGGWRLVRAETLAKTLHAWGVAARAFGGPSDYRIPGS